MDVTSLEVDGYVRVASDPEVSTLDVAASLGSVLELDGIDAVQTLVPRNAEEVGEHRYSGLHGMGMFPLHTDLAHWHVPPRYLVLRCVVPAADVPTHFIHTRHVFGPEAGDTLKRALFRPRRRQGGRLTCVRLSEGECYRWDSTFISPVNRIAHELRSRIMTRLATHRSISLSLNHGGDCLLVDNWKVLHGRAPVPSGAAHRKLERVYLEALH